MQGKLQSSGLCSAECITEDADIAFGGVSAEVDADYAGCLVLDSHIDDFFSFSCSVTPVDGEYEKRLHGIACILIVFLQYAEDGLDVTLLGYAALCNGPWCSSQFEIDNAVGLEVV